MTNFSAISNQIFASTDKNAYIEAVCSYDLLILDDLGSERSSSYMMENVFQVIDRRVCAGKPMIITTNLTVKEMRETQNMDEKRIYDRVLQNCQPICVNVEKRADKIETIWNRFFKNKLSLTLAKKVRSNLRINLIVLKRKTSKRRRWRFRLKQRKLNYRFHNPNSAEDTADFLCKLLIEANAGKVERAIEEAASRCAEESEYIAEPEKTEMVEETVNIRRRRAR